MSSAGSAGPSLLGWVALGGAAGGLLRWLLGELVPDGPGFALTTWCLNVLGSFALALLPLTLLTATARRGRRLRPQLAALLGPGLLGGFTTLSAYSLTTRDLLAQGRPLLAAAYSLGTLVAALAGVAIARRWESRAHVPAPAGRA
ncbi:CrcB family protein [Nocardioides houyundeii]|uniref:CrcB family protein n=1 Tax=Nocardioides houyundeii TaxID=2045452 RepID=UPI0013158A1F|nr:CrcB family protein [Nocardioides houyundeii]